MLLPPLCRCSRVSGEILGVAGGCDAAGAVERHAGRLSGRSWAVVGELVVADGSEVELRLCRFLLDACSVPVGQWT